MNDSRMIVVFPSITLQTILFQLLKIAMTDVIVKMQNYFWRSTIKLASNNNASRASEAGSICNTSTALR